MPTYSSYSGEIAIQLGALRTKGHDEAALNRPASDSLRMDQHEAGLQTDAEKSLASEQMLFDIALTEASRAIADIQQKTIALEMSADQLLSDSSLLSTIEADMAADRQGLVASAGDRMRAEVDWRHFRAINDIQQQANYPESQTWHYALIAFLALVETCINAFFYENSAGLLGGVVVAFGVSIVNMFGALFLGMGWRYKNLAAIDKRVAGWLCFVLFVVLSIYCNALFSSFRAEYQLLLDPTDTLQIRQAFTLATGEAKKVFLVDMHFADLMSFILFGVGFILSCLAFYKGYTSDDKYPDHGRKDRLVKKMQFIEIEKQDLLREKVKVFLHRRRAEVQAAVNEPSQLSSRASMRISELQGAAASANSQARAVQRDFQLVLSAYRDANAAVRATATPAYFKEVPDLTGRVSCASAEETIAGLTATREEIHSLRDRLQGPLRDKIQAMQGDSATILNQTFGQFLRDIEAEAQGRIDRLTPAIHRAVA